MNQTTRWIAIPFLILFALLVVRLLQLPFFYDDNELWMINASSASLGGILRAFIPTQGEVLLPHAFYRPITHLAWWVDGALWGDWIPGYRITNMLLYSFNAFMGYKIALQFNTRNALPAMLTCLVFLFHPLHLEVIAWTAARGDLLALSFMSLAIYCHMQARWQWVAPLFIAALLCKETALVLPLWIVVYDLLLSQKPRFQRKNWLHWVALVGIAVAYLGFRILFFKGLGGYQSDGPSLHLELLQSPWHILKDRLIIDPLQALLMPWPGLAASSGRYQMFHLVFVAGLLILALLSCHKPHLKTCLITLAAFLVVALGSYLPGCVVPVSADLENGRMLFASSLPAALLLGFGLTQFKRFPKPLYLTTLVLALTCLSLAFCLAIQPWERAGNMLRDLPNAMRHTYGNLTPQQEILFVNNDLGFINGALGFSTTPEAFRRALHVAYGRNPPRVDWQHPASAHKFTPSYWARYQIGDNLHFAEWQPASRSVIDLTPTFKQYQQQSKPEPKQLLSWTGQDMLENLVDHAYLSVEPLDNGAIALHLERADSWLALRTPTCFPNKLRLTWSSDKPAGTALTLGLFWVTNQRPDWRQEQSLSVPTVAGQQMVSEIEIPYHYSERLHPQTVLQGIRIDPGGRPGVITLHSLEFLE